MNSLIQVTLHDIKLLTTRLEQRVRTFPVLAAEEAAVRGDLQGALLKLMQIPPAIAARALELRRKIDPAGQTQLLDTTVALRDDIRTVVETADAGFRLAIATAARRWSAEWR